MEKITKIAQSSSLPLTSKDRTWGGGDMYLISTGFAIATWSFLSGGYCASLTTFVNAVIITMCAGTLGYIMLAVAMGFISAKYGIDGFNGMVASMGRRGMIVCLVIFACVNIGWVAVLGTMVAGAFQNVIKIFTGNDLPYAVYSLIGVGAIFIAWLMIRKGTSNLKYANRVIVPCVLFCCAMMAYVIIKNYGWTNLLNAQPTAPVADPKLNVTFIIDMMIGGGLSWFTGWGGLVRVAKTERASYWPNMLAMGVTGPIVAGIACAAGYAVGNADPTTWMIPLGGTVLGIMALIFVCIANIGSAATQMYVACIGLKQFGVLKNKSWQFTTLVTSIPIAILCCFNESVYTNFCYLLSLSGVLYAPLSGIMTADYFILRKQTLDLRAIYDCTKTSQYRYAGGFNIAGYVSFIVGILVYCYQLNPLNWAVHSNLFVPLGATIPSYVVAAVLYLIIAKAYYIPKHIGGYDYSKEYRTYMEDKPSC